MAVAGGMAAQRPCGALQSWRSCARQNVLAATQPQLQPRNSTRVHARKHPAPRDRKEAPGHGGGQTPQPTRHSNSDNEEDSQAALLDVLIGRQAADGDTLASATPEDVLEVWALRKAIAAFTPGKRASCSQNKHAHLLFN
jgi:hypothetical protein